MKSNGSLLHGFQNNLVGTGARRFAGYRVFHRRRQFRRGRNIRLSTHLQSGFSRSVPPRLAELCRKKVMKRFARSFFALTASFTKFWRKNSVSPLSVSGTARGANRKSQTSRTFEQPMLPGRTLCRESQRRQVHGENRDWRILRPAHAIYFVPGAGVIRKDSRQG